MLQKIRDNTQGLIAKIFIGFVIAIFALFGIDSIVGSFLSSVPTLNVNGEDIQEPEIASLTQQKMQEFFANLGPDNNLAGFDETQFRQSAIAELIQRELLLQSAAGSGMEISPVNIDRRIAQIPDFQIDGVFNAERASLLLNNIGYSPASYRAALATDALLNQIIAGYTASGFATPAEVARLAALTHQKRSFRFVELGLNGQSEGLTVSPEEIQAYYAANPNEFMQEERVIIEYLELDKALMMAAVEVTEEQLIALYEEQNLAFEAQTERRASHILFEAGTEEEYAAAEAEAGTVQARLAAGEDFAALAAEFSDDTGSAQGGGDVGYTTGSSFVDAFEQALQALALEEVSSPVRTEFGFHLIKLTELNATEIESFEVRRTALEQELRARETDRLFVARSEELSNLAFESVDLDDPAAAMALSKQRSEWFGRSGGTGVAVYPAVANAAFSPEVLEDGLNSDLIQLDSSRSIVLRTVEHQQPDLRPLSEVSGEIEVLLRIEKASEQARLIGETIVSSLQAGDNIDGLLTSQGLAWNLIEGSERSNLQVNPELMDHVFTLARPAAGTSTIAGYTLGNGNFVVIELQSVTDGSNSDLQENEEAGMRNFLSQQAAANDFTAFMDGIEKRATIKGRD
jgi:peptidyl-prolyl cis-trans isomerase D